MQLSAMFFVLFELMQPTEVVFPSHKHSCLNRRICSLPYHVLYKGFGVILLYFTTVFYTQYTFSSRPVHCVQLLVYCTYVRQRNIQSVLTDHVAFNIRCLMKRVPVTIWVPDSSPVRVPVSANLLISSPQMRQVDRMRICKRS